MKLYHKIKKSSHTVYDYLTDMQKFVSVHPVISKMEKLHNDSYLVFETLQFGFIPYSFTYTVTVSSDYMAKRIVINATIIKSAKIQMTFNINADGAYSIIEEEVNFKTSLPIKSIMKMIFKKQHETLFKNIESAK
ncbi:MAG: SRPBCC domain-containing protein [Bacteroidia bacterium]